MVEISKRVLKDKWGEGISEYYLILRKSKQLPLYPLPHFYSTMKVLSNSTSPINYKPVTIRHELQPNEPYYSPMDETELLIDLGDEAIVDFFLNNPYNDKWVRIWSAIRHLKLNIFEEVIYDYVFIKGYSIDKISKITDIPKSSVYRFRTQLIQKIKDKI